MQRVNILHHSLLLKNDKAEQSHAAASELSQWEWKAGGGQDTLSQLLMCWWKAWVPVLTWLWLEYGV